MAPFIVDDFPRRAVRKLLCRWKTFALIMIVFLAAGYAVVSFKQPTFVSTAPLFLSPEKAVKFRSLARSEAVLQLVIDKVPNLPGATRNAKLEWLVRAVTVDAPSKESSVFNLKVEARSPDEAKSVATVVLEETTQLSKVRPIEEARMRERLERTEAQLTDAELLLNRLREEATTLMAPNALSGEIATSLARLLERRDSLTEAAAKLRESLQGTEQDIILRMPNTPDEAQPRGGLKIMMIAAALGFFFAAIICIRDILREIVERWFTASPAGSELTHEEFPPPRQRKVG